MRNVALMILCSIVLSCCSAQSPSYKKEESTLLLLKDSLAQKNGFTYLNEISIKQLDSNSLKLISQIQKLSENKWLQSVLPQNRLSEKTKMLNECFKRNLQECDYVAEGYEIRSNKNELINIAYSYNQFGSTDSYFKYGCYDSGSEKRITYSTLFKEPLLFLKDFNEKYISQLSAELADYEEEDQEYDFISHYIKTKEPFQLFDLNNFELILIDEKFVAIRFHYNGLGGNYKSIVPNGFIEYSLKELEPQLKKAFLKRVN